MSSSGLLSLEELYSKVNTIFEEHLDVFRGLLITEISIDKALKPTEQSLYAFFIGVNKNNEKSFSVNLWIPNEIVKNYYNNLSLNDKEKKGVKLDIKIDKIFSHVKSGLITIIPSAIKETGLSDRELLRRRLHRYCEEKGYYNRAKKSLTRVVSSILAITSKGSEIKDDVLSNLNINSERVTVAHCATSDEITSIIQNAKPEKHDIIVLFRGGREDEAMGIFSHEAIIEAIVHSSVPVCVALGHDVDRPFICEIADKEYSAPSAFAKAIAEHNKYAQKEQKDLFEALSLLFGTIKDRYQIIHRRLLDSVEALSNQINEKSKGLIEILSTNIDAATQIIKRDMLNKVEKNLSCVSSVAFQIAQQKQHKIEESFGGIHALVNNIALLNQKRIESAMDSIGHSVRILLALSLEKTDKTLVKIEGLCDTVEQNTKHNELLRKEINSKKKMKLAIIILVIVVVALFGTLLLFRKIQNA